MVQFVDKRDSMERCHNEPGNLYYCEIIMTSQLKVHCLNDGFMESGVGSCMQLYRFI